MFACCSAAAPSASTEAKLNLRSAPGAPGHEPLSALLVDPQGAFLGPSQRPAQRPASPAPSPALPSPRAAVGRFPRVAQKCADDVGSSSTGGSHLGPGLGGPASSKTSSEERFPRWNPLAGSVPGIADKELPTLHDFETGVDASPAGWAARAQPSPRHIGWSGAAQSSADAFVAGAEQTREERLHAQVHAFVRKAQKGISVYLCDMESMLLSQCCFRIDETTTTLTLQTALAPEQELQLKDLTSLVKDEALKKRAPRLAHASGECLLLAFGDATRETLHCLLFKDTCDRNRFHTNMKVVRAMAARGPSRRVTTEVRAAVRGEDPDSKVAL